MSAVDAKLAPFQLLDEPVLSFAPDDLRAVDIHPLRGLINHGPFSARSFGAFTPALRVAMVGPQSGRDNVVTLMKLVQQSHRPSDRKEYVPEYPGFQKLFGVPLRAAAPVTRIVWPDALILPPFHGHPPKQRFPARTAPG